MHFDLVDLRLFVFIAEESSLTRAAARAHLSLPAASMRVKHLEQALGVQLLNRESQGVSLRPPGRTLLHHARKVLNQLESLRGDLQEYATGIKGHVRVLANTTAITEFIPPVLSAFLLSHPDVNTDLRERLSRDIVRAVRDGTADIGIVADSADTSGLQVMPYRQDRLVLAAAARHPLARRRSLDFAATLDYDYIALHEGSAIHSFLTQAATQLRRPLKIRTQVSSFEAVCRMIAADVGIGILPESAARRHACSLDLQLVRLSNVWAVRNLLICVRELDKLPLFARQLIAMLEADGRGEALPPRPR
ncbi:MULTISPECIES: LysR substrate-binding domain-containing protein [Chromobacterium]|uniref:LysR substrate-binding domain-containing protein n=1 Tax=Chromobacterium aquaticum TaxID=467180 RepID=A0ABV8ZT59_9NEIS|nr:MULTISPECIES: LysR substrate-binding domain-containing protein [Chromobacterium]KMN33175.1 LysR family transcriptional regulator [Chromobacterium sp. LK1]MCD5364623.1 LysR substrate-binding domain-containing protein [Chromobacterium aquaticum]